MNPWLAATLAALALAGLRAFSRGNDAATLANAGQQAGAGQTSDQGGGYGFDPFGTLAHAYDGGSTQPASTVSYSDPGGQTESTATPAPSLARQAEQFAQQHPVPSFRGAQVEQYVQQHPVPSFQGGNLPAPRPAPPSYASAALAHVGGLR